MAQEEERWYLAIDENPEGPFSSRDLDVKYRT